MSDRLPPGQQLVARNKWPIVGERQPLSCDDVWSVTLREGTRSKSWSLPELLAIGVQPFVVDIHCVTRWSRPASRFTGIALQHLVDDFAPTAEARYASFVARTERRHSSSLPLDIALQLGAFLAVAFEDQPLAVEHGGPVRLVVPERYFYKSVKWLDQIEFLPSDRLGYWEAEAGYHNVADPWQEQRFVAAAIDRGLAARLMQSKELSGLDLMGFHAAGGELQGLRADAALLRNADFQRADLRDADFRNANLSGARLGQADLRNANFCNADLEGADFAGADLRGADFRGASLFGASFLNEETGEGARIDQTVELPEECVERLCPAQLAYVRQEHRK